MPEYAEELSLRRFSDDSLDGCREAGHHGFLACCLVYIGCHGDVDDSMVRMVSLMTYYVSSIETNKTKAKSLRSHQIGRASCSHLMSQ